MPRPCPPLRDPDNREAPLRRTPHYDLSPCSSERSPCSSCVRPPRARTALRCSPPPSANASAWEKAATDPCGARRGPADLSPLCLGAFSRGENAATDPGRRGPVRRPPRSDLSRVPAVPGRGSDGEQGPQRLQHLVRPRQARDGCAAPRAHVRTRSPLHPCRIVAKSAVARDASPHIRRPARRPCAGAQARREAVAARCRRGRGGVQCAPRMTRHHVHDWGWRRA